MNKILILHPDFADPGGVANYYRKLKGKFHLPVEHFIIGKRPGDRGALRNTRRMVSDYRRFIRQIRTGNYQIVHLNPSLDLKSFLRDGLFILLTKKYRRKTLVFFRGWQERFAEKISHRWLWLFRFFYRKADAFIVLASSFEKQLRQWGCKQPIYREVTVADDDALADFDIEETIEKRFRAHRLSLLFLSRIVKEKGVYLTVEAFSLLVTTLPGVELYIAGDGGELAAVKKWVGERKIPNVHFTGYLNVGKKKQMMEKATIFCYPTRYGEGMPNTLVEAMGFGLPVITRPVGGIADFFIHGEHGFLEQNENPQAIAEHIKALCEDKAFYSRVSRNNYLYARSHFSASQAAKRLEKIYRTLMPTG